jgi:hypothetical protein
MRIVLGAVVSRFLPGEVLHRAQYVEGLRRLGHDVIWIEELEPKGCVDGRGWPTDYAHCANTEGFRRAMAYFGLEERSAQIYDGGRATVGLGLAGVLDEVGSADLLLNFSGHVRHPEILDRIPRRAYLDSDPVFTQLWNDQYEEDLGFDAHHVFFTRGANLAAGLCRLPDCGLDWQPYMPPLVLDLWPALTAPSPGPFTTIAAWGRYGDLFHEGDWYRSKTSEFRRFADLPRASPHEFRLALSGREYDPETADHLVTRGWRLLEGGALGSVDDYVAFIRHSGAEIGVAKHAYVRARTGWFSERSTQYLASGKPVLVQDTGLEGVLPTGRGLVTFETLDEAAAGAAEIMGSYPVHARAARELATACFDHEKLLDELLQRCFSEVEGSPPPRPSGGAVR